MANPPASITRRNAAHWRKKLAGQGNLSPSQSNWRGALSQKASQLGALMGLDEKKSYRAAEKLLGVADYIPGVGDAATGADAYSEARKGNYKTAGALSLASVVGLVPGAGDLAAAGIKQGVKKVAKQGAKKVAKQAPKRRAATAADFSPDNIANIRDHDDWAILTAANPMGKATSAKANAKANAKLRSELEADGHEIIDSFGKYDNEEPGFAVLNMPEDRATHYGKRFNQDSVLTNRGLVYHDGRVAPAKGVNTFTDRPDNYFTELPNGSKFALDIDFDNITPAPVSASAMEQAPIGALSSRLRGADVDNMISTRRPSEPNYGTQGNPDEELLIQNGGALRQTPKAFNGNMGMLAEEPFMQGFKGSPDEIYDEGIRRGADNLKYIVNDLMDPELVGKARPWYETANRISREAAGRAGIPDRAAYGVAAVTSPQKPWDINVANMERLIDMHGDRFTNSAGDVEDGLRWVRNRLENPKTAGAVAGLGEDWARRVMEAPYEELTDQFDRYGRVVLTDAIRNDPMVPRILPDGAREGDYGKITWGSGSEIGKALNILDDPSMPNISSQMEGGGKVPSFYNNIAAPNSTADIATIDTHSAGALSLFPGGGKDPIVYRSMGLGGPAGSKPGALSSAITGSKGLYGPAVDMHALAGKELGMLPREVQSATWEGVRNLWGQNAKTPALKKAVSDAWLTAPDPDAARDAIRRLLGR